MIDATPADNRPRLSLFVIALVAFLTVVDFFASQAILPSLAERYGVSPSAMGVAVNFAALGMAVAAFLTALLGARIDRRNGVAFALLTLSLPTILLAFAPNLQAFAALRFVQGLLMAAAFSLTLAYLGERCSARAASGAFAAYVTGNVAANLFGRLLAASVADRFGLHTTFLTFAALNAAGGALALYAITATGARMSAPAAPLSALSRILRQPPLAAAFAVGFLILFAFVGVYTYVNFVLVRAPFSVERMSLGLVYLVFAPSIVTTPFAGALAARLSARLMLRIGLGAALGALPLLLAQSLFLVLAGMTVFAVGAFFAQAAATGHVSRTAQNDKGAASGLYLASYYAGGLAGAAALGALFDAAGWAACLAGVATALVAALAFAELLAPARKKDCADAAPHQDDAENAFLKPSQKHDPLKTSIAS